MQKTRPIAALLALLALLVAGCAGRVAAPDLKADFSERSIQGFQQFPVYSGTNYLGFIPSGPGAFNFRVWEGLVRQDPIQQTLSLTVTGQNAQGFSAGFLKVASAALDRQEITAINLVLINPVVYNLENPFPAPEYAGRADFLARPFVGALLHVDRIKVEFTHRDGFFVTGSAALPYVSPTVKLSVDQAENALILAEDAFIGYRLVEAPPEPERLAAFTLDYQFLLQAEDGGWRVLGPHDAVRAGDSLRFQVRASHPAWLYVFNLDSGGAVHLLFPREEIAYRNPLEGGRTYTFPHETGKAYQVDQVAGVEEFVFLLCRQERPEVAELLGRLRQGGLARAEFEGARVVAETRGVGQIGEVRRQERAPVAGFPGGARQIQGLPADYKEVFLLQHR